MWQGLLSGKRSARGSAVAVTAAIGLALIPLPASAGQSAHCQQVSTRVSIDTRAPQNRNETVAGTLCTVGKTGTKASVVQLLVHGITYDRSYWDFPVQPEKYSYVRAANAAGCATLAIDRVGSGVSSKPSPEALTTDGNAQELLQIVRALRAGQIGGRTFDKVILVGHSYGAFTGMIAANGSLDIDGLIVSGYDHYVDPRFFTVVPGALTPAAYDAPQRCGDLPPGYLTSRAGTRPQFYYMPNADPEVVEHDEATKQLTTDGEMTTFPPHHFDSRGVDARCSWSWATTTSCSVR